MTQMVNSIEYSGFLLTPADHPLHMPITQDPYLNDLMKQPGDKPVFHVALMPAEGLANITQEVAERVADKMASINAMGVPVWL
jgi:hypothetical protein